MCVLFLTINYLSFLVSVLHFNKTKQEISILKEKKQEKEKKKKTVVAVVVVEDQRKKAGANFD